MKIATWNVNSIRARVDRVVAWTLAHQPDVLCLQETKVEDGAFPLDTLAAAGYQAVLFGQRAYNGVAILARTPITEVKRGFDDGHDDGQARFIVGTVGGIRVASIYVPNGKAVGTDKFVHKLAWLDRCLAWLRKHADPGAALALCGDYNVAPTDLDVYDPVAFRNQVLCHPEERLRFEAIKAWGVRDVFQDRHPEGHIFSWWDYRMLGFPKNRGARIDHILCTPALAGRVAEIYVDRAERKGRDPSDHAPVVAEIGDPRPVSDQG